VANSAADIVFNLIEGARLVHSDSHLVCLNLCFSTKTFGKKIDLSSRG
jgi:hypothetical protein